jgi:hypothetical protein
MEKFWINQRALEEFTDDHLEKYTIYTERQLGRSTIILAQIRAEWDRRYPPHENGNNE